LRPTGDPFRQGVILIGFHSGVSIARQHAIERRAGAQSVSRLGPAVRQIRRRTALPSLVAPLLMKVERTGVLAAIRRLRGDPALAYAEPDYTMHASAVPNDPFFPAQWGDRNTGQAVPGQESEELLGPLANGSPEADDKAFEGWGVTTGSRSIVVGETDTGADHDHVDLRPNIWSNPGGIGGCPAGTHGYDVLDGGCDSSDEDTAYGGHGTHVAGIIGAVGGNGIGVAGMDWQSSILPVKWLDSANSGATSDLIEALQWLVNAKQAGVNVRVVNDSATFFGTARSQALAEAIRTLGENNILFVTAAGNTGDNNDNVARYPCDYGLANEICVTASDNNDQLPSWANYGPHTVDLAAPGVSIYSTLRNGTYGYLSGGSMAAPQVAGAAALILSVAPSLSATELKSDILGHVDPVPSLSGRVITGGRLDVCKALPGCPPAPPSSQPSAAQAPAGATLGAVAQAAPRAVISRLIVSPRVFAAASAGGRGGARAARISYSDSKPARSRLTAFGLRPGIENARHRCVSPTRRPRKTATHACVRSVFIGSFLHQDRAGRNTLRFGGRVGGKTLAPGLYRLQVVPEFEKRIGVRAAAFFRISSTG
jgi:subtilisin family serine protease